MLTDAIAIAETCQKMKLVRKKKKNFFVSYRDAVDATILIKANNETS
jgi:NAD-specific glutamate dehydrogenase